MRLGGKLGTHLSSRPRWIEAGSPIEGPRQRSEHVIVIGYRWEFVRASRRASTAADSRFAIGRRRNLGGAQKGQDS